MSAYPVAGGVAVEVVADLSQLEVGLRTAQDKARVAAQGIANDLVKIEAGARDAGKAAEGAASGGFRALEQRATALRSQVDPLFASQNKLNRIVTESADLFKHGALSLGDHNRIVDLASRAHSDLERRVANSSKTAALSRNDWTNLSYQLNDAITMAASGASAFQILATQGGQVFQVLQGARGGVAGVAADSSTLAARIGLVGAALGGLTLAVGVGAAAWASYRSEQQEVEQKLSGIGRASGTTLEAINRTAEMRTGAGLSVSESRRFQAEYAGTGRIGSEIGDSLQSALHDYAALTGQDVAEANKVLAASFADPVRGVETLNQQLGYLDDASVQLVKRLDAQGHRLGAQRIMMQGFAESTKGAAERLGFFEKSWTAFWNTTSNEFNAIGRVVDRGFGGGTPEQRLQDLQGRLDFRNRNIGKGSFILDYLLDFDRGQLQQKIAEVQLEISKALDEGLIGQAKQRSTQGGAIVRALNPEAGSIGKIETDVKNLGATLADAIAFPDVRIDGGFSKALASYDALKDRLDILRDQYAKGGEAASNALRQADFTRSSSGLDSYARGLADINRQFDEMVLAAKKAGEASQTVANVKALELGRSAAIDAFKQEAERAVAQTLSIPRGFAQTVIGIESGGRANASNRLSSAAGYGGFIDQTFLEQFRSAYPSRAATMSDPSILSLKSDLDVVTTLIDQYAKQTARALERGGLEITDRNLYLGHFLGPGGAVKALQADPRSLARDVLGDKAAIANPSIIGGGHSIEDVLNHASRVVARNSSSIRGADDNNAVLRSQSGAIEQSIARTAELQKVQELLNDERSKGTELGRAFTTAQDLIGASSGKLTPTLAAQREELLRVSRAYGQITQSDIGSRAMRRLFEERDLIGMTSLDARAFSRTRAEFRETDSDQARAYMAQAKLNDQLRYTKDLSGEAMSGFLRDLRNGASATDALSNALGRVGDRLTDLALDMALSSLFKGSGGLNLFSLFGLGSGSGFKFASGGVMTSSGPLRLNAYASGGIASGPQLALFGEGRGPEAYVPLPDGRSIPVTMQGAAANTNAAPVTVNLIGAPPGVQVQEAQDGQGGRRIDVTFDQQVARSLTAPGSASGRALRQRQVVQR